MNVVIKKSILESFLKRIVEDRGGHSVRIDQIAGDAKPIIPDEQVATQLSQDNVPVEDPNFLPVNKKQLKNAASQMADKIEPEKIQKFYSMMKRLVRKNSEKKDTKVRELELMEALSSFILAEARGEEKSGGRQRLVQLTGGEGEIDDQPVDVGASGKGRTDDISSTPTKKLMKVGNQKEQPEIEIGQFKLFKPVDKPDNQIDPFRVSDYDVADAANKITAKASADKITLIQGPKIILSDKLTGMSSEYGQSSTRGIDEIDKIISNFFNTPEISAMLGGLNAREQEVVYNIVKSRMSKEFASRVPIADWADLYSNAILDMTSKKVNSAVAFKKAVNTVRFSITSDDINVPVEILGVITPYKIEVPKDIDYIELDNQIKSALSTKKTTFWDKMQAEGPDAIKLAKAKAAAEAKADKAADKASSKEVDDEEKIKSDLQIMSDETGIPVGSLRNLSIDFAYIFGEKENGTSSPQDLSKNKLTNYVNIAQMIYDLFIKAPGIETANKIFNTLPQKQREIFNKKSNIEFGEYIFKDNFFKFIAANKEDIEEKGPIMTAIDSFISGLINSEQFEGGYPEFIEFRNILKTKSGATPFTSTKDISATESRLGLTDINSLARFILGFDLVYKELESRCFNYLVSKVNEQSYDKTQLKMLSPANKNKIDALIVLNNKTKKYNFKLSVEDTKEEISNILSEYTEPDLISLNNVMKDFIENIQGGLKSKRDAFIAKIIDLYTDAINN